jgi:hypothetical protein
MNIKVGKVTGLALNGNEISGNTYAAKSYIKDCLDGKWDSNRKVWIVNTAKVESNLDRIGSSFRTDDTPAAQKQTAKLATNFGWCNKCHTYCYGDCQAN